MSEGPASPAQLLAPTPPMGWSSWNSFGRRIDERLIRETADAMVDSGMAAAGYRYVNLDDGWQAPSRDAFGDLRPDEARFPGGLKALGDYLHSKGLKFGIYTSVGRKTCEGFPASYGFEEQDASLFAEWGVDYVKDDFCGGPPFWCRYNFWPWWDYRSRYTAMSRGLRSSGRPIVLSLCNWGFGRVWEWGGEIAQLWRTTFDIWPSWRRIMGILDAQRGLERWSGPGRWNDPDMLEVGVAPLTLEESRTHFSLWAILAAPLIAGNDLRSMPPETLAILANPEVLAVDQDPAGLQGTLVSDPRSPLQAWSRRLAAPDERAVVLLNRSRQSRSVEVSWPQLGLRGPARVRDLWRREDLGAFDGRLSLEAPGHGARMLRLSGAQEC